MCELLAPAGNFEALVAAISNGADAVYLGTNRFGARAYANNFDLEELKKALEYAHLRNIKIYVTMNTVVFEEEINEAFELISQLYLLGVDGLIIQDLALLKHVIDNYPAWEAHCSTQMGIDDLDGVLLFQNLGAKRAVIAREVNIKELENIKRHTTIPLEIFIHGALCVSYSGNCLMSGLIGYRSGNRGRCVGSCRKAYTLIDTKTQAAIQEGFLLSMKDLNTSLDIEKLKQFDSLKIEGRMKEPAYVANVVASYRQALDGKPLNDNLKKTFNRSYTKGYIFNEDKKNVTNIQKPNNYGYLIGTISSKGPLGYRLKLTEPLKQNDSIRIEQNKNDINLTVAKLYDNNQKLINSGTDCYLKLQENIAINAKVYKTKDQDFYNELSQSYPKEYRRFPIDLTVYAYADTPLIITATCQNHKVKYQGTEILTPALKTPTSSEQFLKQFDRLTSTVYKAEKIIFQTNGVYINPKTINDARRKIVENLNALRTQIKREMPTITKPSGLSLIEVTPKSLAVYVTTEEQYQASKDLDIKIIYTKANTIARNNNHYQPKDGELLVGGYGGIHHYRKTNPLIGDYSLNVVNSQSVYELYKLGLKRITLSYEMNKKQIKSLIDNFTASFGFKPNLEMIVYGRAPLMQTIYCPLKKANLCGLCHKNSYALKDEYETFPILSHEDCTTTILNSKYLNLIDELENLNDINVLRLVFTTETFEETKQVIKKFKAKLNKETTEKMFDSSKDTRGHFNKEIL